TDGSEPAATALGAAELGVKQVAAATTAAASGKLYYGEDVDGNGTTVARAFGIGIKADSGTTQSGIPVGGNLYLKEGTNMTISQSVSGDVSTVTFTAAGGSSGMTSFILEDDDGTEVSISDAEEVKFIGSGITTNWTDTSPGSDADPFDMTFTVDAAQTGITSLLATDIKIGEDDQTKIDFETANEIHFYADNAEQVYVADGIFGPQTDADVDLGASGVEFKDLYIDGTAHIDTLDVDVANTFSATKHAPNTSASQTITLTADTPFHTVCCDVTTVTPNASKTVTCTLPAWSEGLYLRIAVKCLGFFIGPLVATIQLEPASGEYLNGVQNGDYVICTDADGALGGVYGIAHVYATVEYADGESSGGTTINTWIVDDSSSVGREI
ncbi:hypothetical protein CMI47_17295, partial [Candidatus Pacearchaeota archaeon]|nr:hypothetical protein [Candidatus Pacearchaeota archaeon]